MAYDAIAHGAHGFLYWGTQTIDDPFFRESLYALTAELGELEALLVGADQTVEVAVIDDLFDAPGIGVRGKLKSNHADYLLSLVNEDDLESTTMEMARKIAAGPPIAIRLSKLMLYKGLEFDLETAMKMAAAAETITLTSQDHREGVQAFREKSTPTYEGR